jgi:hypothetical protein
MILYLKQKISSVYNMKKLLCLFLLLSLLGTSACKDDEGEATLNQTTLDGKAYTIKKALIIDAGSYPNHYMYMFYLTDDKNWTPTATRSDGKILISFQLFSPGSERFDNGTFSYTATPDNTTGEFFIHADALVDVNNNNVLDQDDELIRATGGKVTVAGSFPDYRLHYDLSFPNNRRLVGSYSGTHAFVE